MFFISKIDHVHHVEVVHVQEVYHVTDAADLIQETVTDLTDDKRKKHFIFIKFTLFSVFKKKHFNQMDISFCNQNPIINFFFVVYVGICRVHVILIGQKVKISISKLFQSIFV